MYFLVLPTFYAVWMNFCGGILMQLAVGWTYRFTFLPDFSSLDGIYTVVKIYSYAELLADGLDLQSGLYSKVGKTQDQLDSDIVNYRNNDILKLVNPDDANIIYYVPSPVLSSVPDPNIKKYAKLVVGINVGVYTSEEDLNYILDSISQQLQAVLGYTETPKVFSIGNVWLTQQEYETIVNARSATKTSTMNYYSENVKLRDQVTNLRAAIDQLQEFISAQQDCACGN